MILVVEGLHDQLVIDHYFHTELRRGRVLIVPARGAKNVNALVDAPWLSRLGIPMVILFDDVRADRIAKKARPPGREVAARAVWDLLDHWDQSRPAPGVASFDLPDIFRALPDGAVSRTVAAAGGHFPGWEEIDQRSKAEPGAGYKQVFLRASGLPTDTDLNSLLRAILEVTREKPHPSLERAVHEALTAHNAPDVSVRNRDSDTGTDSIPF
jgi:hypothetical protein